MIGNKQNNDGQGVMTGMTIPKQHHWLFFSQMGNEDVSQEAEKDLLSNPSIQGFFFLEEGVFRPSQYIEVRVPGVGEDQQYCPTAEEQAHTVTCCSVLFVME